MPFHVTPAANVYRILRDGLKPRIGDRSRVMEQEDGIYLFKTQDDAADAVTNWLGDEFEDRERLALLEVTIPPDAKVLPSTADYEIVVSTPIPPEFIKVISKNF
jgi:hypothetical protein